MIVVGFILLALGILCTGASGFQAGKGENDYAKFSFWLAILFFAMSQFSIIYG